VTDVTNASRTQLMNLATLNWDREILAAFDIPLSVLPRIASSSEIHGVTRLPELSGVRWREFSAINRGSHGANLLPARRSQDTYGTGCFLLMNTGEQAVPSRFGLLTTVAASWRRPGAVRSGGQVASPERWCSGCATTWADSIQRRDRALARTVKDNAGCISSPRFRACMRPTGKTRRGALSPA